MPLEMARTESEGEKDMTRKLKMAEMGMRAEVEVLSISTQYFRDKLEQMLDVSRQMAFLVEKGHDVAFSGSYRSAREALTGKLEVAIAKQLAKTRLERARGQEGGTASATDED